MDKTKLKSIFHNNKNKIITFLLLVLIIIVVLPGKKNDEYEIQRTLRYSFTLQNKTNTILKDVDFWVYAPVKETANQKTKTITASEDYQLSEDELGNQVLHFEVPQFAPYASKIIKLETKLLLSTHPVSHKLKNKAIYLQAEKYVEVNDPQIETIAKQFQTSSTIKNAQNTMNWVHQNVKYAGYIEDDRGALSALKARKGDCTEYMYLYTALMRNQAIPTRNIGGYVYGENKVLKAEDFHNWSEIYINGKWQVVDPQNGIFLENQNNYIAFRVISGKSDKKLTPSNTQRFAISNQNISVKIN